MRHLLFISFLLSVGLPELQAQSTNVILNGGWAIVNPEDEEEAVNGFKLGGQYEFEVAERWLIGASISFLSFKSESTEATTSTQYAYQSWPLTAYGKYRIGKPDKIHGYIKGVAGAQISTFKRKSQVAELKDNDFGLSIGSGVGCIVPVDEKLFLAVDYEFLFLTNSFYQDGMINQVSVGLGFRLR